MEKKQHLLNRLDQIGQSLKKTQRALALIGHGSVGPEMDRLDEYSDLDFLVVVKNGHKPQFLEDLNWLGSICPIAYCFKVSDYGYKLLFEDGIFCEFGVFEEAELASARFGEGTWAAEGSIFWREIRLLTCPSLCRATPAVSNRHKPSSNFWSGTLT